jgi:hypothetical protein
MTNKPIIGGTIFRQEIKRADRANAAICRALEKILAAPDKLTIATNISLAALAVTESQAALRRIEQIAQDQRKKPPAATGGEGKNTDE